MCGVDRVDGGAIAGLGARPTWQARRPRTRRLRLSGISREPRPPRRRPLVPAASNHSSASRFIALCVSTPVLFLGQSQPHSPLSSNTPSISSHRHNALSISGCRCPASPAWPSYPRQSLTHGTISKLAHEPMIISTYSPYCGLIRATLPTSSSFYF